MQGILSLKPYSYQLLFNISHEVSEMVNGKRKAEEESKERIWNTRFFISNTFIGNAGLKLAKNQAKAKQNTAAEL